MPSQTAVRLAVVWDKGPVRGEIGVAHSRLRSLRLAPGRGTARGARFAAAAGAAPRLEVVLEDANLRPGRDPASVTVRTDAGAFTVLARDVDSRYPVWIPEYGVAVTTAGDRRDYAAIRDDLQSRRTRTRLQELAASPEESFEGAAAETRRLACPTWLGLSRNIRLFEVDFGQGQSEMIPAISPRLHSTPVRLPETNFRDLQYRFLVTGGESCVRRFRRWLDDGTLPILHAELEEDEILYRLTFFAAPEDGPFDAGHLRGTPYLVADGHANGHMFTPAQARAFQRLAAADLGRAEDTLGAFRSITRADGSYADGHEFSPAAARAFRERAARAAKPPEETVLHGRIEMLNRGPRPRYGWVKLPAPTAGETRFDARRGWTRFASGRVICLARLDGRPAPQEEMAILLWPGQPVRVEFALPHRPIPASRAARLGRQGLAARIEETRRFWRAERDSGWTVNLPERRIEAMVKAGLPHLDLVSYGQEPAGPLAATVGRYPPIGSESAPIILFFDSAGRHDLARRALDYFLAKQHPDGKMQNYGGYELETGAVLFALGEHFRYTRDRAWARRVAPTVLRACEHLLAWRRRNQQPGEGRGLLAGRVADPIDPYHQFMLNGYACVGISRAADLLAGVRPREARRLAREAAVFRQTIRAACAQALARAPVVPLGDGRWCPTTAPWAEGNSPPWLFLDGRRWATHGAMTARTLTGALWLVFQEVLEPRERAADWLLNVACEHYHPRNVGRSQPYYSRHPWVHLKRGEAPAFLKAYYSAVATLADRETYTFWEHIHGGSPHKTHEEAWFLMETRWMLYLEDGAGLRLLPGVPRAWLRDGGAIEVQNAGSYFGRLSFRVESRLAGDGTLTAEVRCDGPAAPAEVVVRLPHPDGRRAAAAEGGVYDPAAETVTLRRFAGRARARLQFGS